jgi:hypothetical protein
MIRDLYSTSKKSYENYDGRRQMKKYDGEQSGLISSSFSMNCV